MWWFVSYFFWLWQSHEKSHRGSVSGLLLVVTTELGFPLNYSHSSLIRYWRWRENWLNYWKFKLTKVYQKRVMIDQTDCVLVSEKKTIILAAAFPTGTSEEQIPTSSCQCPRTLRCLQLHPAQWTSPQEMNADECRKKENNCGCHIPNRDFEKTDFDIVLSVSSYIAMFATISSAVDVFAGDERSSSTSLLLLSSLER